MLITPRSDCYSEHDNSYNSVAALVNTKFEQLSGGPCGYYQQPKGLMKG